MIVKSACNQALLIDVIVLEDSFLELGHGITERQHFCMRNPVTCAYSLEYECYAGIEARKPLYHQATDNVELFLTCGFRGCQSMIKLPSGALVNMHTDDFVGQCPASGKYLFMNSRMHSTSSDDIVLSISSASTICSR